MSITASFNGHFRLKEQLESSSASVPQNIAEGDGRVSIKENMHHLYIARGSLYEAITILNILQQQDLISEKCLTEMEKIGMEIAKMLNSLIASKRTFLTP